ncbi:MAG: helix-turn-helix domain-containing protein [Phycisphaerae bacterium]|nr:helix-turn-helix domain-containing protein [Phycisphaerae bacterium]
MIHPPLKNGPLEVRRFHCQRAMQKQHRHPFEELVLVTEGSGRHWVNKSEYPVRAGDVFVLLGDTRHCYTQVDNLHVINVLYDRQCIVFPFSELGSLPGFHVLFEIEPRARRRYAFKNRMHLPYDKLGRAIYLTGLIEDELRDGQDGSRFFALLHFLHLVGFLSRCYAAPAAADHHDIEQLSRTLAHMESHMHRRLTIRELTRVAGMSESSLRRTFNRLMGCAPIEHLFRIRIDKAGQLLEHTSLSLTEIAERTGFCDSNYLSRRFRQATGRSPRAHRKATRRKA